MRAECATAITVLVASGSTASATIVDNIVYSVEASSSLGSATFTAMGTDSDGDGVYDWNLSSPQELVDPGSGNMIARLGGGQAAANEGNSPSTVSLNFAVEAGAADTTFNISSAFLQVDPLSPVFAAATANLGANDAGGDNGNPDGFLSLTGGFADGFAFRSEVNGEALVDGDGGVAFQQFFSDPFTGPGSDSDDATVPGNFPFRIPFDDVTSVHSLSAAFSFTLSAEDQANGGAVFVVDDVVPTPGTVGLLGLAGLAAVRRRR